MPANRSSDEPAIPPAPGGEGGAPHARVPIRIEEALGAAAMALIAVISFANVVVRYATNVSFAFTEEFSIFLMVFMTFVGASFAFAVDGHIRIGLVADRLGPAGRLACELLVLAASLLTFGVVVWYGTVLTYDQWRFEETSPGLGYPSWIYTVWMPLLGIAVMLRILGRGWARLRRRR